LTDKAKTEELRVGTRVVISREDVASGSLVLTFVPSASSLRWTPGAELDLTGWSKWCGKELVGKFRFVEFKPNARLIVLEKM
jgi:hypothetical protein